MSVSLTAAGAGGTPPRAGAPVRFAARLTSATPCRVAGGGDAPRLTVSSGADRVWSSSDCPLATVPDTAPGTAGRSLLIPAQAVVPANGAAALDVVWPGVRLATGCAPASAALRPGTYTATLVLPGAPPATAVFQLR